MEQVTINGSYGYCYFVTYGDVFPAPQIVILVFLENGSSKSQVSRIPYQVHLLVCFFLGGIQLNSLGFGLLVSFQLVRTTQSCHESGKLPWLCIDHSIMGSESYWLPLGWGQLKRRAAQSQHLFLLISHMVNSEDILNTQSFSSLPVYFRVHSGKELGYMVQMPAGTLASPLFLNMPFLHLDKISYPNHFNLWMDLLQKL